MHFRIKKVFCSNKTKGCNTIVPLCELEQHKTKCRIEIEAKERLLEQQRLRELLLEQQRLRKLEEERQKAIEKKRQRILEQQRLQELERLRLEELKYKGPNLYTFWIRNSNFVGDNLGNSTFSCALGDDGFIGITRSGYWGIGIPKKLHNILIGRQKSLPLPVYVALGSGDRFYVEFADGYARWSGNCGDNFGNTIQNYGSVDFVTVGKDMDSYLIKCKCGTISSCCIPNKLKNKIYSRNPKLSKLKFASLGPNDQWFLKWENGTIDQLLI
eukprot:gene1736-505_t